MLRSCIIRSLCTSNQVWVIISDTQTFHTKMITFIKILKYELNPKNKDIFEYLSDVTSQKINPQSLELGMLAVQSGIVLYSPLEHAKGCIKRTAGIDHREVVELREIPFDLKKLCTKEEWVDRKSEVVRERFKKAFIADTLMIKRKQLFEEVESLLRLCVRFHETYDNVTVVSHSFRLKLIEAYLGTDGKIKDNPELIHQYVFNNRKTYEFGRGFAISSKLEVIEVF